MPRDYSSDEERRLVITTAWERLTGTEVVDHQRKLLNDPRFERDFVQFLDFAEVTDMQIDRVTVAALARFDLFSANSRRAFFAPNSLAYGMSRMFMAFRDFHGEEQMEVFADRDQALRWLSVGPFD